MNSKFKNGKKESLNKSPKLIVARVLLISFYSLFIAGLLFIFNGCSKEPDRRLVDFVRTTKTEKAKEIEKLPTFTKIEPYKYTATHLRSPFETASISEAVKPKMKKDGPSPDMQRPKELLESYPLDSLHMVGTLQRNGKFWALIQDSHNLVHLVTVGNYMGENFGKIIKIEEKSLELNEWVSDGEGGFRERSLHLRMVE